MVESEYQKSLHIDDELKLIYFEKLAYYFNVDRVSLLKSAGPVR